MKTDACRRWLLLVMAALTCCLPPHANALTPVKDSAEDLFWTDPITVHDYKKDTDLHNVAVSTMAMTELEFVRLGDSFVSLFAKNKKNPISKSLDSLEYSYSRLPRVNPVRRFGQFWDALQLRQISLSDARLLGSVLANDGMGGITPLMQVRAYKLVVFVEDIIYDLDRVLMSPINWGTSSLSRKPVQVKSLGYVADGLGLLRWQVSAGLKLVNREVVRVSSKFISLLEKPHDSMVRRKRKKQNALIPIYSKMPLSVFQDNRRHLKSKKNTVIAGTLEVWRDRIYHFPFVLPDNVQQANIPYEDFSSLDPNKEIIVAAPYLVWEKTPQELKKYVITSEEFEGLMKPPDTPPSPTPA